MNINLDQIIQSLEFIDNPEFVKKQLNYVRKSTGLESLDISNEHLTDAIHQTKYELNVKISQEGILDFFKKKPKEIPYGQEITPKKGFSVPIEIAKDSNYYTLFEKLKDNQNKTDYIRPLISLLNELKKIDQQELKFQEKAKNICKVIDKYTTMRDGKLVPKGMNFYDIYASKEMIETDGSTKIIYPTKEQLESLIKYVDDESVDYPLIVDYAADIHDLAYVNCLEIAEEDNVSIDKKYTVFLKALYDHDYKRTESITYSHELIEDLAKMIK